MEQDMKVDRVDTDVMVRCFLKLLLSHGNINNATYLQALAKLKEEEKCH